MVNGDEDKDKTGQEGERGPEEAGESAGRPVPGGEAAGPPEGEAGAERPAEVEGGQEIGAAVPGAATEPETPAEAVAEEPAAQPRRGELRRYVLTAAASAGVLIFALAFFMAGFAAHALLDDDGDGGGTGAADGGQSAAASASDDDPSWGPEDAAVTIEEFADFQCPFCGRHAHGTLPQIREAYGDQVRYIYRDFPLTSIHQFAEKAAEAGQCAHEQGLFWEYHDVLFDNQDALAVPNLKAYAEQVGADTGEFNDCLDSGKNAREVLLDLQDGRNAGVSGTPAFLINGLLFSGAQPFEQFQVVIDQALAAEE